MASQRHRRTRGRYASSRGHRVPISDSPSITSRDTSPTPLQPRSRYAPPGWSHRSRGCSWHVRARAGSPDRRPGRQGHARTPGRYACRAKRDRAAEPIKQRLCVGLIQVRHGENAHGLLVREARQWGQHPAHGGVAVRVWCLARGTRLWVNHDQGGGSSSAASFSHSAESPLHIRAASAARLRRRFDGDVMDALKIRSCRAQTPTQPTRSDPRQWRSEHRGVGRTALLGASRSSLRREPVVVVLLPKSGAPANTARSRSGSRLSTATTPAPV